MEKRSRRRIRDLVAHAASLGISENKIGCARISMVARNTNVPFKGRIQKRKTYHLQIITFRLQRAAGPYRSAISGTARAAVYEIRWTDTDPPGLRRCCMSDMAGRTLRNDKYRNDDQHSKNCQYF